MQKNSSKTAAVSDCRKTGIFTQVKVPVFFEMLKIEQKSAKNKEMYGPLMPVF